MNLYSIYDVKADVYNLPVALLNDDVAKRMLLELLADTNTTVSRFPADFYLYLVGEFDNRTGELTAMAPFRLCSALDVVPLLKSQLQAQTDMFPEDTPNA